MKIKAPYSQVFLTWILSIIIKKRGTQITTQIDNVFANNPSFKYLSGNITTSVSDHLTQFIILENFKRSILKGEQVNTTYRDGQLSVKNNQKSRITNQKSHWKSDINRPFYYLLWLAWRLTGYILILWRGTGISVLINSFFIFRDLQ